MGVGGAPVTPVDRQGNVVGGSAAAAAWDGSDVTSPYSEAVVEVSGLSGGDTIVVSGKMTDAATAQPMTGIALDFTTVSTITEDGIYSYSNPGTVSYAQTGSASTPTVTILARS